MVVAAVAVSLVVGVLIGYLVCHMRSAARISALTVSREVESQKAVALQENLNALAASSEKAAKTLKSNTTAISNSCKRAKGN